MILFCPLSAGAKALKKMKGLQEQPKNKNSYGGAYGMSGFGVPLGTTSYHSTNMPIAMAAPISWQSPVSLAPSQPSASQPQLPLLQ